MSAAELTFYYNLTTLGKTAQGENCTKRNDKIWMLRTGGRKVVCIQDDMHCGGGVRVAPIPANNGAGWRKSALKELIEILRASSDREISEAISLFETAKMNALE